MSSTVRCAALLLLAGCTLFAQAGSEGEEHGFSFYERFQGSVNTLGSVNDLDSSVGYKFNPHLAVDAGIPLYFVRPSTSTTTATAVSSSNGIGNVYGQVRLTFANPVLNFESTLTGTAPTGDQATGFSTGHATVDWSNYFDHNFSRLTPFANVGIANSVSDTAFFIRPYMTYGTVTHLEGGARYRLIARLSVAASAYAMAPSGQQTVVSRIVKAQSTPAAATRHNGGVFEKSNVTTGSADIAKDHGFSTWAQLQLARSISLYAGYSRSTQYSLDTIFYGISVNLGSAFRSLGI